MPEYRRAFVPGGTFFFTLVTQNRVPLFREESNRALLRGAIETCRRGRPFVLLAVVLLHDHLHLLLKLPDGDVEFSTRLASIKAQFTRAYLNAGDTEQAHTDSRIARRNRGVWQRRFWEHAILDEEDFGNHLDYIHYNPVEHGLAACPHAWPHSSFEQWVKRKAYDRDWMCSCEGRKPPNCDFQNLAGAEMD